MDALVKSRLDAIFNGKKVPPLDFVEQFEFTANVKKEDGLGLELKHLMVVSITYNSPCQGQIKVGDVLLSLNGTPITGQDKMGKLIQTIFNGQLTTKMSVKVMRLKRRIPRPSTFPPLYKHEGYTNDTLVLYNLKGYFHLGLDIKELDGKLIVCDFVENSLADITFSLGEAILDVDGEKTSTCTSFNDRVRKSLEIRNYCLVTVEVPSTDPLKNLLRNQITKAVKDVGRINKLPLDAATYAAEGVAIFKKCCDGPLKSAYVGDKHGNRTSENASRLKMEDKVKETDVPTGWNSRLFVRLPPAKTLESETLPQ
ncbi:hypothetical protein L3Y34_005038 [Caenorhabditis briggsae]|uniref:PDZ domain-containing protein n=1 Tax=Caenorhabditis briggsae TaxID=6238 RepID=A0AAE9AIQ4_CAEBR|nr:hypothetical protein L3Y34_005038 [Caenorhabditis briggsae]